jgi:hypothetical protein
VADGTLTVAEGTRFTFIDTVVMSIQLISVCDLHDELEVSQRLRDQLLPHHEDLISEIRPPGKEISHTGAYNLDVIKSSRQTNVAKLFLKTPKQFSSTSVLINIIFTGSLLLAVSVLSLVS